MALPRPSCLRGAAGRSTFRKAGSHARTNPFRQAGRRTYASGHEAKASSDIPWIIGSTAVTAPAAVWLFNQGPSKSDHGHDEEEPHEVNLDEESGEEAKEEDGGDESKDDEKEEGKEEPKEEGKQEDKEEPKEESKEESKEEPKQDEGKEDSGSDDEKGDDTPPTSDDEEYDGPSPGSPGQINKNPNKGPGEGQKGQRKPTEKKGEKDAAKNHSGATNPYLDDDEKSKKAEGVRETAKIHGTVDPKRNSSKE